MQDKVAALLVVGFYTCVILYLAWSSNTLNIKLRQSEHDANDILLIGIPSFLTVTCSCYVLHFAFHMSQWSSFLVSLVWFGLSFGYLSKLLIANLQTEHKQKKQNLFWGILQALAACSIYTISDYYTRSKADIEHYTILFGVGVPLCAIGQLVGSIGEQHYKQRKKRSAANAISLKAQLFWYGMIVANLVSDYAWTMLGLKDIDTRSISEAVLLSVLHISSLLGYAVLVAKRNRLWTDVLLQLMLSYLSLVILLYVGKHKDFLLTPCYMYLPMSNVAFWMWVAQAKHQIK